MMKTSSLVLLALLLLPGLQAAHARGGFYIGFGGGATLLDVGDLADFPQSEVDDIHPYVNVIIGDKYFIGESGMFVGAEIEGLIFGDTQNNFFYQYGPFGQSTGAVSVSGQFRVKGGVIAGYGTDALNVYVRGGLGTNRFDRSDLTDNGVDDIGRYAVIVGGGLESKLFRNVSLRADIQIQGLVSGPETGPQRNTDITLSLIYAFYD